MHPFPDLLPSSSTMTDASKPKKRFLPLLLALLLLGVVGFRFLRAKDEAEPSELGTPIVKADAAETERGLVHFPKSPEERVARERAAAFFRKDRMGKAREALLEFASPDDASQTVILDMAAIEFSAGRFEETDRWLERAVALDSNNPRLIYLQAQRARGMGDFEDALPLFQKVHEKLPSDFPTMIGLGQVLAGLDRPKEAEALYRKVIAYGPEHAGSWYMSAVYRMTRLLLEDDREEEAERFFTILDEGKARGFKPPTAAQVSHGELGVVLVPAPAATERGPVTPQAFEEDLNVDLAIREAFRGALALIAVDYDGDRDRDLLGSGPGGVVLARNDRDEETWTLIQLPPLPTSPPQPYFEAAPIDLDNDGDQDLAVLHGGSLSLWVLKKEGFEPLSSERFPKLIGSQPERTIVDIAVRDWDHEGDLDLVLVLASGEARLWRNDGFSGSEEGKFTDATAESGISDFVRGARWVELEDFDGDNDVDLLFGSESLILADSLRGGRFGERNDLLKTMRQNPPRPQLADIDNDGRVDLTFPEGSPNLPKATADFDGDGVGDEARLEEDGLHIFRGQGSGTSNLRLTLRGVRDNFPAVGAVVELRSGADYQRFVWDGSTTSVGLGTDRIDVLRITWPNGVIQEDVDIDLKARTSFETSAGGVEEFGFYKQIEGLIGSCPFLYSWNGEEFVFISDVLGITPLGLPMAPGLLVPPDHDEYVLITAEQLAPKDGEYVLQFTEELREVTYLDRVRLDVIDHPQGTEIQPNERFCFPPFPEPHIHTAQTLNGPKSALDPNGRDWSSELQTIDDKYATPFEAIRQQFMGLANPHWLELSWDPADADGKTLRLYFTGWLFWTNASINMASARTPGVAFVPPILQIPDGEGGWQDVGPPVGFPAGKTKTMVLDVSEFLDREDPRLRVFSTLRLHWDRIALCADEDDVKLETHSLELSSAKLWNRGFSRGSNGGELDQPEMFTWGELTARPRWDQHPGFYTKYGECTELFSVADDRFAILGTGDALELKFDARQLPPVREGWRRDFLLYLDGWAKDRDPNTVRALEVEPLPHHGMSAYPYDELAEPFPDGPEWQAWRAEWNTRAAKRWVRPLAPKAEAEWLLE